MLTLPRIQNNQSFDESLIASCTGFDFSQRKHVVQSLRAAAMKGVISPSDLSQALAGGNAGILNLISKRAIKPPHINPLSPESLAVVDYHLVASNSSDKAEHVRHTIQTLVIAQCLTASDCKAIVKNPLHGASQAISNGMRVMYERVESGFLSQCPSLRSIAPVESLSISPAWFESANSFTADVDLKGAIKITQDFCDATRFIPASPQHPEALIALDAAMGFIGEHSKLGGHIATLETVRFSFAGDSEGISELYHECQWQGDTPHCPQEKLNDFFEDYDWFFDDRDALSLTERTLDSLRHLHLTKQHESKFKDKGDLKAWALANVQIPHAQAVLSLLEIESFCATYQASNKNSKTAEHIESDSYPPLVWVTPLALLDHIEDDMRHVFENGDDVSIHYQCGTPQEASEIWPELLASVIVGNACLGVLAHYFPEN